MLSRRKSKGIRISSVLFVIFIVVMVICMYGAFQTYLKIQSNQRELDAVAARLEAVQQRNEDLEGYSQPEFFNNYMEERARAIGYARPNEQVFYITPN